MKKEQDEITIWGVSTPRTFRPIWTAEELGLAYKHLPIGPRTGETLTAEYTQLNPKQKIPFATDGSVGFSESIAISRYLVNKYAARTGFYRPTGLIDQAKEDEWICYIYGELDETSLYVMRRHGDLQKIYGSAPAAVESSKIYAEKHLNIIDQHMSTTQFVMGEEFGLADIILCSTLDWTHFYGFDLPDKLREYRHRAMQRPAYQKAFAINYPDLSKE